MTPSDLMLSGTWAARAGSAATLGSAGVLLAPLEDDVPELLLPPEEPPPQPATTRAALARAATAAAERRVRDRVRTGFSPSRCCHRRSCPARRCPWVTVRS